MMLLLVISMWALYSHGSKVTATKPYIFDYSLSYYPTSIPEYPLRTDPYDPSLPLHRGRFRHHRSSTGRLPTNIFSESDQGSIHITNDQKVTYEEFQHIMQCSPDEPGLNQHGTFSMLEMIPPTKEIMERLCAYTETQCRPWSKCQTLFEQFRNGSLQYPTENIPPPFRGYYLLSVSNGSLYIDWPWGRDRYYNTTNDQDDFRVEAIHLVSNHNDTRLY